MSMTSLYTHFTKRMYGKMFGKKIELRSKLEFKFTTAIAESRIAKNRLNSGKIFFSTKTKTINLCDENLKLEGMNLPKNLECIKSSTKEYLKSVHIPEVRKLWI